MESTLLLTLSSGLGTLIALALEIAMIVVALGPVRRHRPEASMVLAGSAGLNLFCTILWIPATTILAGAFGPEGYRAVMAVIGLVNSMLRGISGLMLIVAILRLATPPASDPTRYT